MTTQRANADDLAVTRAELRVLVKKLETVPSLVLEMTLAMAGGARVNDNSAIGRSQPASRPPYPIHLEDALAELANELSTVIRDMCETRGLETPTSGNSVSWSRWIIRYRTALAVMAQGRELYDGLCTVIDRCARTMNQLEAEYVISQPRLDAANRQVVTSVQVEKLAHKLGDEGKGLNKNRVDSLRRRHGLRGTQDPDTKVWFYRLGDVIQAHREARQYRPKSA